jgi:primosomal protein N'
MNETWSKERKEQQRRACQNSAETRRCPKCKKGAALVSRKDGLTCRYCEFKPANAQAA